MGGFDASPRQVVEVRTMRADAGEGDTLEAASKVFIAGREATDVKGSAVAVRPGIEPAKTRQPARLTSRLVSRRSASRVSRRRESC